MVLLFLSPRMSKNGPRRYYLYYLCPPILSHIIQYLDALSLGQMDIASTNSSARDVWLSVLKRVNAAFHLFDHSAESLQYIFDRKLSNITQIKLSRNRDLYENIFFGIGPKFSLECNWKYWILKGCPILDNHLQQLSIAASKHIITLDLSMCTCISDHGIQSVLDENLKELDISVTNKSLVSDTTLINLANNCKQLQILRLNHCYSITNSGISVLVNGCNILHTLELVWCNKLSDISLLSIASSASSKTLSDLSLSDVTKITDRGIAALSNSCSNISRLVLNYCRRLTDTAITGFQEDLRK
jgi:hypothetical protein